jgi:glycosyltransferase involved in cell wall biosynthesis
MNISIFHNIVWSKYKGGVFSAIHDLTSSGDDRVSFTQIAETEGERVALGGVDRSYHSYPYELIFPGSYGSIPLWKRIAALTSRAISLKADLVILPGFERAEYWAMLMVLIVRGVPRAVFCDSTVNDRPQSKIKSIAKRIFFSNCQGFFCYGTRSKEYIMRFGVPERKVFFRCQAAALRHDYSEERALIERLANAPKATDAPRFIYVGRLSAEKGLRTLIGAMDVLVRSIPNARLEIIGAGPLQGELHSQINELRLQENVLLLGSMDVTELAAKYLSATAFVLPSTSEPWGLVVNEALSYGCPVIVSEVCGCVPELVVQGKTGLSFKAGDIADLYNCLRTATSEFKDTKATANNCIQLMRQFTPQNAAKQILIGARSITHQKV